MSIRKIVFFVISLFLMLCANTNAQIVTSPVSGVAIDKVTPTGQSQSSGEVVSTDSVSNSTNSLSSVSPIQSNSNGISAHAVVVKVRSVRDSVWKEVTVCAKDTHAAVVGQIAQVDSGIKMNCQLAGKRNVVTTNFNGALIAGFSNSNSQSTQGAQIAGFSNYSAMNLHGTQVAGFRNVVKGDLQGSQVTWVYNVSAQNLRGAQVAGIFNKGHHIDGVQVAGLFNIADSVKGVQMATLFNRTNHIQGVQMARFFNMAKSVKGVQLAIVNYADTCSGAPIGFFSYVKKGYHRMEVGSDELHFATVAFGTGVDKFHNIFLLGVNYRNPEMWSFGYGVGSDFAISKRWSFCTSLTAQQIQSSRSYPIKANILSKLYVGLEYDLFSKMSIDFGPTLNVFNANITDTNYGKLYETLSTHNFYSHNSGNYNTKMWLGAQVTLKFF